jgi:hypothetical protein
LQYDRVCIKAAIDKTCFNPNVAGGENGFEFLYVDGFTNPALPAQTFKPYGIMGLAPTNRTQLGTFLQYLVKKGAINSNAFTLNQNLIGSKSNLQLGYFNNAFHMLNYTLTQSDDLLVPIWTFPIGDVSFGQLLHPATVRKIEDNDPLKTMRATIDNIYQNYLFQMTESFTDAHAEAISNTLPGSQLRNVTSDGDQQVYQAYFP